MTTTEHIQNIIKEFKPTGHKINLFNPNIQDTSTRYFKIKDHDGDRFKLFVFSNGIIIETRVKTSVLFTINLPDIVCFANKHLNNEKRSNKIYTNHSNDSSVLKCVDLIEQDIQELRLELNEGLFVYGNVLQLALNKTRQLLPELLTLKKIKSKVEINFPEESETFDTSKIPANLQDLIPLFREWSISDDLERGEKINQSSRVKLQKVIGIVNPKMNSINDYLDSFKSAPLTYEATLIGNLAQLVSELALRK